MGFSRKILDSELSMIMERESQMRELYSDIASRLGYGPVRDTIEKIRKDEERHVGYVRLIMELLGPEKEKASDRQVRKPE